MAYGEAVRQADAAKPRSSCRVQAACAGKSARKKFQKGGIINMKITNIIALTLVVIGALNWGLIGFFGYDVVTALFHENLFWIARTIFALVGLAGIWCLTFYHSVGQDTGR